MSDTLVDLRVDDHERPIEELRRLYALHEALFGRTARSHMLEVDDELRGELRERLGRLGYTRLADWAGVENLEGRVKSENLIDPVVLEHLRRTS